MFVWSDRITDRLITRRDNFIVSRRKVNTPVGKSFTTSGRTTAAEATFGDRLRFVVWLSALRLGVASGKELAEAIGSGPSQLSKWIAENPRPEFNSVRRIAEKVGVSALWLDDPSAPDAREPELFAEWWAARQRHEADQRKRA